MPSYLEAPRPPPPIKSNCKNLCGSRFECRIWSTKFEFFKGADHPHLYTNIRPNRVYISVLWIRLSEPARFIWNKIWSMLQKVFLGCCVFWLAFRCHLHTKAGKKTFFLQFSEFFSSFRQFFFFFCMKRRKNSNPQLTDGA